MSTDWLQFGFDAARSGVNPTEKLIMPATVAQLHRLWRVQLPAVADSSPALLARVRFADCAGRDVLYVTTRDGRLLALDAGSGAKLWEQQPRGAKITQSSPVVDRSRMMVWAYGLDGKVHAYRAVSGEEIRSHGFPLQVTTMTRTEKESSALNLANGRLYVTTSGYFGDAPPYQGHVIAVDLDRGSVHVWNALCSNVTRVLDRGECRSNGAGIWARAGAVIDPVTGNIFVATGNGRFNADRGGHDYGDSVLELSRDGSRLLDSYTPSNQQELDETDEDLGSTAPALLPEAKGSKTRYLAVQGGKDGKLRLLDRNNLGGRSGPGHIGGELQTLDAVGCDTFTQPVVWRAEDGTVWVTVAGTCGITAYRVTSDAAGVARLTQAWTQKLKTSTPVLAGGVLFAAANGAVHALDPKTGEELWSSTRPSVGGTISDIHWQSPIVSGGKLYIADESGGLSAYGL